MIKLQKNANASIFCCFFFKRKWNFSNFKTHKKLIQLVESFKKFDIDSYFIPNNDQHNVNNIFYFS